MMKQAKTTEDEEVTVYFYDASDDPRSFLDGKEAGYAVYRGATISVSGDTRDEAIAHLRSVIGKLRAAEAVKVKL